MRTKFLWLGLSFLLVAALVLTSCGEAEPGEQEEEEEEEEEEELETYTPSQSFGLNVGVPELGLEVTKPKYGGSITILETLTESAGSPQPIGGLGTGATDQFRLKVMEKGLAGDIYQYGAFGNGTFLFKDDVGTPLRYATGVLWESWDITPNLITFHIRPGIYWTGESINPGVMDKREYTAEDYKYSLLRRLDADNPQYAGYFAGIDYVVEPWVDHVRVVDKYTVEVDTNYYHSQWDSIFVGGAGRQMARENWEAGGDDWNNLVGTGPFIMDEFVQGSHVTVRRNPDYWQKCPINGKLYPTPFLDEVVMPMILDESTAAAALRTGTVDVFVKIKAQHVASLDQTNPELNKIVYLGNVHGVRFNTSNPPLD
jgi:peptide/nickel transport system substrate-binding protein